MRLSIQTTRATQRLCPCGCGHEHPLLSGIATAEGGAQVLFHAAKLHSGEERHLWLLVGTGPVEPGGPDPAWFNVELWRAQGQLASRLAEPGQGPWRKGDLLGGACLAREAVLQRAGAKEWLFGWTDALATQHPELATFLLPQS